MRRWRWTPPRPAPAMPTDPFRRSTTMEATNGKTRGRGLGPGNDAARRGSERQSAVRLFRDIHGAEYKRQPTTVLVECHDRRNAPGDDDVLRRHWTVVCADRRGAAER